MILPAHVDFVSLTKQKFRKIRANAWMQYTNLEKYEILWYGRWNSIPYKMWFILF